VFSEDTSIQDTFLLPSQNEVSLRKWKIFGLQSFSFKSGVVVNEKFVQWIGFTIFMIISFLSDAPFINGRGIHTNCHLYQYIIWVQGNGLKKLEFNENYMFNLLSNHRAFSH